MKRKLLSVLLASSMLVSLTACGGNNDSAVTNNEDAAPQTQAQTEAPAKTDEAAEPSTEATDDAQAGDRPTTPQGQLILGTITDLEQDFYDPIYNSSSTNYKLTEYVLHGYTTVITTKEGEWITDPMVVSALDTADNEDGTKTFTITLNDGLLWTDNSAVTAKDYAFAMLLESSPEMMGVDNYSATRYTYLDGYDEFNAGDTKTLKGVHLIDDKTFSVTVKADELPYHYDLAYASVTPRPIAVIAPGCEIEDSEEGATITGDFTTDVLLKTIGDPNTGYRYNPQVTCGPYKLVSYDASSRQGTFEVNENFVGNYAGIKPMIKTLIIKTVKSETQINELKAGTVDLLYEIGEAEGIEPGLDLVDEGLVQKHTYFRYGYGLIRFDCSQFPTDSQNVRQAVAYCLDRNEFARQFSGGYATVVHGEYGLSQWEYLDSKDWIDENLNTYDKDIEKAKEVLAADGWTLNKDGGEYKDGDGTRYKDVDGELKPLVIEWCNSEGNPVSELLNTMLPEAMKDAGMELKATTTDFPTLLTAMDHEGETMYNMYNLATGFSLQHSPWYYYSCDDKWMGNGYNASWIKDKDLEASAVALKTIPFDDNDAWLEAWRTFQKTWNEKLPVVPLYSNEYHDFYVNKVHDWDTSSIWDWSTAVTEAWVEE